MTASIAYDVDGRADVAPGRTRPAGAPHRDDTARVPPLGRLCRALGLAAALSAPLAPATAQPLPGFADMHTHPMAHLGFGGGVLYGAPDVGSLMLPGQIYGDGGGCNERPRRAVSPREAMGNDTALHGMPHPGNRCGDVIRKEVVGQLEEIYSGEHPSIGWPTFAHWPHWTSVSHQQMWVDWIRRAHDGGLNVMVALAVNNALLAKATNGGGPHEDAASVSLQLSEMRAFVRRHADFMAIATTPAELRRIVASGRLAVVLGVETDDLGDLARRVRAGGTVGPVEITGAIDALYAQGVRYVVPLHFSNTPLGGYAINRDLFALSSREYTGAYPSVRTSCGAGVHFVLTPAEFDFFSGHALRTRNLGWIIDGQPDYGTPPAGCGHVNALGLNPLGRTALGRMMDLGMMIDVDHMSRAAVDDALALARRRDYPLNSGHNAPLRADCLTPTPVRPQSCHENARTAAQYQAIRELGGMVGLGLGPRATAFARTYGAVLEGQGNRPVAVGSDANGLFPLPGPDPRAPVRYDAAFPRFGHASRTWDYDVDGFAHYGMFPDFLRSLTTAADPANRMSLRAMEALRSSAEGFARMWEKSLLRRRTPMQTDYVIRNGFCRATGEVLHVADVNGDGASDLLCRSRARLVIDHAAGFTGVGGILPGSLGGHRDLVVETAWCTHAGATLHIGDVDGDGRADLLCKDAGRIWVNRAGPGGVFDDTTDWHLDARWCTHAGSTLHLGDFDGDGRTDLLCRDPGRLWVNLANPEGRFSNITTHYTDTRWCTHAGAAFHLGDFDGDGRTDLLCKDGRRIWLNLADRMGRFRDATTAFVDTRWCTHEGSALRLGDFDGDGRTDLLCHDPNRLWVQFARDGTIFRNGTDWHLDTAWCAGADDRLLVSDTNGDGNDDAVCHGPRGIEIKLSDLSGRL